MRRREFDKYRNRPRQGFTPDVTFLLPFFLFAASNQHPLSLFSSSSSSPNTSLYESVREVYKSLSLSWPISAAIRAGEFNWKMPENGSLRAGKSRLFIRGSRRCGKIAPPKRSIIR